MKSGPKTGSLRIRCGKQGRTVENTLSQTTIRTGLLKGEARDTDAGLTL
jgi:hypothetical protein